MLSGRRRAGRGLRACRARAHRTSPPTMRRRTARRARASSARSPASGARCWRPVRRVALGRRRARAQVVDAATLPNARGRRRCARRIPRHRDSRRSAGARDGATFARAEPVDDDSIVDVLEVQLPHERAADQAGGTGDDEPPTRAIALMSVTIGLDGRRPGAHPARSSRPAAAVPGALSPTVKARTTSCGSTADSGDVGEHLAGPHRRPDPSRRANPGNGPSAT